MIWKLGLYRCLWGLGFPKIRDTFAAPRIRSLVWGGGAVLDLPILGNHHMV